jgi:hypothetical protein
MSSDVSRLGSLAREVIGAAELSPPRSNSHTISEGSVRKSYSARAEIRPSPEGFPRDFVCADREAILRKPYQMNVLKPRESACKRTTTQKAERPACSPTLRAQARAEREGGHPPERKSSLLGARGESWTARRVRRRIAAIMDANTPPAKGRNLARLSCGRTAVDTPRRLRPRPRNLDLAPTLF